MAEFFSTWELWQIILTVVFGGIWLVFFILDHRRKAAAKKRKKQMESEEKSENT